MIDGLEGIAMREADLDGLGGEADRQPAGHRIAVIAIAATPRRCRDRITHRIDDQFRPALTPEVRRRLRAVDNAYHLRDFLDAWRDASVRLADAENGVTRSAEGDIALNLGR